MPEKIVPGHELVNPFASVGDILDRIAGMGQLPVKHDAQLAAIHHHVGQAGVAMNQSWRS